MPVIEQKTEQFIINRFLEDIKDIAVNVEGFLKRYSTKDESINSNDRTTIEDTLSILVTDRIKYIYILYRDRENIYRFFADGSKEDRAMPGEIFEPMQREIFDEAYQINDDRYIVQEKLKEIGITYLHPLRLNNNRKALLVVDFSLIAVRELRDFVGIVKKGILGILTVYLMLFLFGIIQTFRTSRFKKRAYTDRLTGIYNRNYLEGMEDFVNYRLYDISMVDIDHFKRINDTYGHDVGDIVLREVATVLRESIREHEDIPIRYGGEEFLIMFRKGRNHTKTTTQNIAKRILENIRNRRINAKGNEISITVSIGINNHTENASTLKEAIKRADMALYRAKQEGRDRICLSSN
jgi:diguanylate cyclase (GGDEF)-like protein